jgi:hypothetical protein
MEEETRRSPKTSADGSYGLLWMDVRRWIVEVEVFRSLGRLEIKKKGGQSLPELHFERSTEGKRIIQGIAFHKAFSF